MRDEPPGFRGRVTGLGEGAPGGESVVTKERFEQGLTLQQYVDKMTFNRERFVEALEEATIEPEDARVPSAPLYGVVTRARPVVVDFWAPWGGPCRFIAPVLYEISREVGDQATIAKVNVDEEPALASRFGVQAIPQLVFFKDGVEKDRLVGAAPKREIVKRLDTLRD